MNAESEKFDQLCRLLKLKRHEAPPPRYFDDFSGQVISRLEAGTASGRFELLEAFVSRSPWVRRLWRAIEQRPAAAGLLTTAGCGLLVIGVIMFDTTPQPFTITADGVAKVESPGTPQPGPNGFAAANTTPSSLLLDNRSNAAMQLPSGPSLFGEFPKLGAPQRVNGLPIPNGPK